VTTQEPTSEGQAASGDSAGQEAAELPICGIIRPIAAMVDGYTESHWLDVHNIVAKAAKDADFHLRLVSEGGTGIIVADIIDRIYNDALVICDVSGRNPNVMFELGMRVTFEKPVIIIKDDSTPFSFDITPIRHLEYRRDLRMPSMVSFQTDLSAAIRDTMEASKSEKYRHYLQQFGPIKITQLKANDVDMQDIVNGLQDLRRSVSNISSQIDSSRSGGSRVSAAAEGREGYTSPLSKFFSRPSNIIKFRVDCGANKSREIQSYIKSYSIDYQLSIESAAKGRLLLNFEMEYDLNKMVGSVASELHKALFKIDPTVEVYF